MHRLAVVSDHQVPHHRWDAIQWQIAQIQAFEPTHLIVNGDLLDYEGLRPDAPSDLKHDLLDELWQGASVLEAYRRAVPDAEHWYLHGNHEERIVRQTSKVEPYLRRATHWTNIRGCDEYGHWRILPYKNERRFTFRAGAVSIRHGFTAARNAGDKESHQIAEQQGGLYGGRLVVMGHTHRPYTPRRTKIGSQEVSLWHANTGTCCNPSRMPWTGPIDTSHWAAGLGLFLTGSRGQRWGVHRRPWTGTILFEGEAWDPARHVEPASGDPAPQNPQPKGRPSAST